MHAYEGGSHGVFMAEPRVRTAVEVSMTNNVDPSAFVGEGVKLGTGNTVGPYAVLLGPCEIGNDNWIAPHAVVGTPGGHRDHPHPATWAGETGGLGVVIGDRNRIREHTKVAQGLLSGPTRIGSDCLVMSGAVIGDGAVLEDGIQISANVVVGGESRIWSRSYLGMGAMIRPHTLIGPLSLVCMGAVVLGDVGAAAKHLGNPATTVGANVSGLRHWGCGERAIATLHGYVAGTSGIPDGLPDDVSQLLARWDAR
ncbi:UDP-N-acetylglucosamine acyltransferase [Kitasatospora cystarginea]